MIVRDAAVADLTALTVMHCAAFAGAIGPVVGRRYVRAFLRWFIEAKDGTALVAANDDGTLLGYVFGAPVGYGPRVTRDLAAVIAAGVLAHLPRVVMHPSFRRQVRARVTNLLFQREPRDPIFDAAPADAFCLVGIGTDPHARRRGAGKALVDTLCERARAAGSKSVILDVFRDNAPAVALYTRAGFTVLASDGRIERLIRRV